MKIMCLILILLVSLATQAAPLPLNEEPGCNLILEMLTKGTVVEEEALKNELRASIGNALEAAGYNKYEIALNDAETEFANLLNNNLLPKIIANHFITENSDSSSLIQLKDLKNKLEIIKQYVQTNPHDYAKQLETKVRGIIKEVRTEFPLPDKYNESVIQNTLKKYKITGGQYAAVSGYFLRTDANSEQKLNLLIAKNLALPDGNFEKQLEQAYNEIKYLTVPGKKAHYVDKQNKVFVTVAFIPIVWTLISLFLH